jgi:hypothetical protein
MPVQTRAQKKASAINNHINQMNKEEDEKQQAALILLKLNKDNEDLKYKLNINHEILQKKKEELVKLREIKRLTDEYNMMRMIVHSYNEKADILEIRITELMSSIDN